MPTTVEDIGKHLGKTVEDAMGRPVGKFVGLTPDIKDEVKAIQVVQSNGEVNQYSIDSINVVDGQPVLLQGWRVEAEKLRREHDIVRRRRQALDLLLKDGDIDQAEYNQLRGSYEDLLKEIKVKRDRVVETLNEVDTKLEHQIRDLQTALTNNKMLYTSSEIGEQTYREVTESIRAGIELARKERKDVENTRESLHGIDSLELPEPPKPPPAPSTKVPDVVVVKVREPTPI